MADSQFCLEWDSHNKNICNGLSSLQQNGEFVDMTLAADGHHVKVHQMVMALASPYIKDLISTANCPHPVIFLNRVSYKTLCSILEYIYTGQALVAVEDINDLIIAAKELHIKGLEDVKTASDAPPSSDVEEVPHETPELQIKLRRSDMSTIPPQISVSSTLKRKLDNSKTQSSMPIRKRAVLNKSDREDKDSMPDLGRVEQGRDGHYDNPFDADDRDDFDDDNDSNNDTAVAVPEPSDDNPQKCTLHYSVSRNGVLKLVLNRFVYSAEYSYSDGRRKWRCSNRSRSCRAFVVTKDNVVVRRSYNHTHPYQDKIIMRMMEAGSIVTALPGSENLQQKACTRQAQVYFGVSKNGNLKLVMNRYVYFLDYRYADGRRKWSCSNRMRSCKAAAVTNVNNIVVQRIRNHTHPFHDKKIMRMAAAGCIVTALPDGETELEKVTAEKIFEQGIPTALVLKRKTS